MGRSKLERSGWTETANLSTAGLTIVIASAIGYFGGNWLDERLHTQPWLAVIGLLLGSAGGLVQLFQAVDGPPRSGSRSRARPRDDDRPD